MPDPYDSTPSCPSLVTDRALSTGPSWYKYRHGHLLTADQRHAQNAQLRFLSVRELLASLPEETWVIDELIPADTQGIIWGPSRHGKSFVALDMALHTAMGWPWHDGRYRGGTGPGPILYLAHEDKLGIAKRIAGWCDYHRIDLDAFEPGVYVSNISFPFYKAADQLKAALDAHHTAVGQHPKMIINDTLARSILPGDENSTLEMSDFMQICDRYLREPTGATVMHIHHTGHASAQRTRGSTALPAGVEFQYSVRREDEARRIFQFRNRKMKNKQDDFAMYLKMEVMPLHGWEQGKRDDTLVITGFLPDYRPQAEAAATRGLTAKQRELYEAIRAFAKGGETVSAAEVRAHCVQMLSGARNPRDLYAKRLDTLRARGLVRFDGDWLVLEEAV